jgi:PAS domain S-box-containing protein
MRRSEQSVKLRKNRSDRPHILIASQNRIQRRALHTLRSRVEHIEHLLAAETARRQFAEEALSRNQNVLDGVAQTLPHGAIIVLDKDQQCVSISGQELHTMGVLPPKVVGHKLVDLIKPRDRLLEVLVESALGGESGVLQTYYRGYTYEIHAAPLSNSAQQVERVVLIVQNVSSLKQAASEHANLASIVEQASDPIITETLDGLIQTWNPAAERLYGYADEDIVGCSAHLLIPPDRATELDVLMSTVREGKRVEQFETVRITKDGSPIPCLCTYIPIHDEAGCVVGISSIHHDIRKYKLTETQLATSNERFNQLVEHLDTVFWMVDMQSSRALYISPQSASILGVSPPEVMQDITTLMRPVHHEDRPLFAHVQQQLAIGIGSHLQYRIVQPDGTLRWVELRAFPIRGTRRAVELAVDVTEQRRLRDKLQERERFVTRVADTLSDILYIFDLRETRNVFVNQNMARVLGYTPEETQAMGSKMLHTLMHPEDSIRIPHNMVRIMSLSDSAIFAWEYRMRHADGSWHWMYSREMIFQRDAAGHPVQIVGVAEDITLRKQLEQIESVSQLQQEQLRRLATFVNESAHDFRTVLTAINSILYLMNKPTVATPEQNTHRLLMIEQHIDQMTGITDQLEHIAKIEGGDIQSHTMLSLSHLLSQVVSSALEKWKTRHYSVRESYPSDPITLLADANRLSQAFAQVMDNAFRYTPEGGSISIQLRKQALEGIVVEIMDNGPGFAADKLAQAYNNYPHTRLPGNGLILARRIIEQHRGTLHIESKLNQGTRVEIWFPI